MNSKYCKLIPFVILFQILSSLVINEIYLLSRNTLKNNDNWIIMKKQVQMSLLGAENYYSDKVALRQRKLNLGAWHGFQGVIYKERVRPDKIEFDFFLSDNSYFYFIFDMNKDKFRGFRFSSHEDYKNMLVKANSDGMFIDKSEILLEGVIKPKWNSVTLDFKDRDNFEIFLNDKSIAHFNETVLDRYFMGFRGSYSPAYIDNIVIKQKGSDEIFKEKFSYRKNWIKSGVFFYLAITGISIIICLFLVLLKAGFRNTIFSLVALNIVIFFISLPSFFAFYYANEIKTNYPGIHGLYRFYRNLMKEEIRYVNRDAKFVNNRILREYNHIPNKNTNRFIFLGTSQTRGAGADTIDETIVKVIENVLNKSGVESYECINAGVHGTRSDAVAKYYKNYWISLKPKVAVINLSNNDNDKELFRQSLMNIVEMNKSAGIESIFILEANSREVDTDLKDFHKVMKEIAKDNNILIIDLHNYLINKGDTGILWWDSVHMTSYGQRIAGEFIANKLLEHGKK